MDDELRKQMISLLGGDSDQDGENTRAEQTADRLLALLGLDGTAPSEGDVLSLIESARRALPEDRRSEADELLARAPEFDGAPDERDTRGDRFLDRMRDLDASSNARSHFERLTGQDLGRPPQVREPQPHPPVRHRLSVLNRVYLGMSAAAAIVFLFAVAGHLSESGLARSAHESVVDHSALRGYSDPEETGAEERRDGWMRRIMASRNLRLGIWPDYDHDELTAVEGEMVTSTDSSAGFYWLLGVVRLMRGDHPGARAALDEASRRGNVEAAEWLKRMEAERD